MKAVVMAGGHGTRLRPLTSSTPKPLLPIANRPMLEHVIDLLKLHGITELIFTVSYLADMIQSYFGDGTDFGVEIRYSVEQIPLGTAGSVYNVKHLLEEPFLVISGDVLTDFNLTDFINLHRQSSSLVSVALKQIEDPTEFGIVICNEDNVVEKFTEKPTWGQVFSDTINTGIYAMDPQIFDFMVPDKELDFSSDIFPELLNHKKKISGFAMDGYWEDVGNHLAYLRANKDVLDKKINVNIDGFEIKDGVFIGEGVDIDPTVHIASPCIIDSNCTIDANCSINPYSVIGSNVKIRQDTIVEHSVIMDNSFIGYRGSIRGSIVGRSCEMRNNVTVEPECVLGDGCVIGDSVLVEPNVKIYSKKVIEPGVTVTSSIVFETRANRNLFGDLGIEGYSNVDISPEFALKVAMAYGSLLKKGSKIVVSRDTARSSRILKRAMMVGFNAVGVDVLDLEVSTIPVMSHAVVSNTADGGCTVRLSKSDPLAANIRIFNENGIDIDEAMRKKIERVYFREEFRKVVGGDLGDINMPSRAIEEYCSNVLGTVNLDTIGKRQFKVVLNYSYGTISFIMPNLLAKLNADVFVINPYAATYKSLSIGSKDLVKETLDLVGASGAAFGAIFDADGESIKLIDDNGRALSDSMVQALLVKLLVDSKSDTIIYAPINATQRLSEIVSGTAITLKTINSSVSDLEEILQNSQDGMILGPNGKYILLNSDAGFDSAALFCYLLELLAKSDVVVSDLVDEIGPIFIQKFEMPCGFDSKGTFMRTFTEDNRELQDGQLDEGVKLVNDDGWIFVLPDSSRPVLNIWVEGNSIESLNRLTDFAKSNIEKHIPG